MSRVLRCSLPNCGVIKTGGAPAGATNGLGSRAQHPVQRVQNAGKDGAASRGMYVKDICFFLFLYPCSAVAYCLVWLFVLYFFFSARDFCACCSLFFGHTTLSQACEKIWHPPCGSVQRVVGIS